MVHLLWHFSLQFLHFSPNNIPFPHTMHVWDIQYFVENLCFIEFPRSLRGICGDQRGTERVFAEGVSAWTGGVEGMKEGKKKDRRDLSVWRGERCVGRFSQLPTLLWILRFKGLVFFLAFGVCVSSKRFPSWNSWDLLRCRAVKPGSRWISLRLGGGGVPGALTLFLRRIGGVPGGVMVLTTK